MCQAAPTSSVKLPVVLSQLRPRTLVECRVRLGVPSHVKLHYTCKSASKFYSVTGSASLTCGATSGVTVEVENVDGGVAGTSWRTFACQISSFDVLGSLKHVPRSLNIHRLQIVCWYHTFAFNCVLLAHPCKMYVGRPWRDGLMLAHICVMYDERYA